MPTAQQIAVAQRLGLTAEQIASVMQFESSQPRFEISETGTVTTGALYSPDRIAQRRAELARERARL